MTENNHQVEILIVIFCGAFARTNHHVDAARLQLSSGSMTHVAELSAALSAALPVFHRCQDVGCGCERAAITSAERVLIGVGLLAALVGILSQFKAIGRGDEQRQIGGSDFVGNAALENGETLE